MSTIIFLLEPFILVRKDYAMTERYHNNEVQQCICIAWDSMHYSGKFLRELIAKLGIIVINLKPTKKEIISMM
jgi:hypothetical protein